MSNAIKLTVSDYTDKSVVVQGEDTRKYKEELKNIGGKYNANLKTGPGWIFPKNKEHEIKDFIESAKEGIKEITKEGIKEITKEIDLKVLFKKLDNIEKMLKLLTNKKDEKLEMVDCSSEDEVIPISLLRKNKNKN
jgi:hypothetical protein